MRQCAIKTIVTGDEVESHRIVRASLYPRPALVLTYFERGIVENKNTSVYALFQHESLEDLCLTQLHLSPVNSSSCSSGCAGSVCVQEKVVRSRDWAVPDRWQRAPRTRLLPTSSSTFCWKETFNCWWASTCLVILSSRFLQIVSILIKNRARNTLGSDFLNYLFPHAK